MKKPIVLCVVSLMHGDGGKYIATNIAYSIKSSAEKGKNLDIVLVDANKYDASLADSLLIRPEKADKNSTELTSQLKFNINKLKLEGEESLKEFKKIINGESDYVIISTEIDELKKIDSICKNKTNILVVKNNSVNNAKIESNIDMIKENFKYVIINCPEKTVKITKKFKENNIKIIGRIVYNEYTLDNMNIAKATKLNNIKHLKNFGRIALIKIRKD